MARLAGPFFTFRALRYLVSIETLVRWAWSDPRASRPRDLADEERVVARLTKVMHLSGRPDGQCLARSLALYRALSRRGADPTFVIGFRRERESVMGHAWVEVDGAPVDEPAALIGALTPTCAYGRGGRRITPGDGERGASFSVGAPRAGDGRPDAPR